MKLDRLENLRKKSISWWNRQDIGLKMVMRVRCQHFLTRRNASPEALTGREIQEIHRYFNDNMAHLTAK